MAATTAGPEFEKAMRPILEGAGPLPHGRLQLAVGASSHSGRRKKTAIQSDQSAAVVIAAILFIPRADGSKLAGGTALSEARSNGRRENVSPTMP